MCCWQSLATALSLQNWRPQNLAAKCNLPTRGSFNARAKRSYVASDAYISCQRLRTPTQNIVNHHNYSKLSLILGEEDNQLFCLKH